MDDANANYDRARHRYYDAQAKAPRASGTTVPRDLGPMTEDEIDALGELADALDDLRAAHEAWVEADRPAP